MMMWYSSLMSMPCDEVRFRVRLSKVNDLTFCARVPCTYELIHALQVYDSAKLFDSLMGKTLLDQLKYALDYKSSIYIVRNLLFFILSNGTFKKHVIILP